MSEEMLFRPGSPAFYVTTITDHEFENLRLRLQQDRKNAVVRVIRGNKSMSLDQFFNEVAAALQFPYYFGENWPAFSDCITDLEWVPGDVYMLLIRQAQLLLREETPDDFRILIGTLERASEEWKTPNKYIPRNRPYTIFTVIFQVDTLDLAGFGQRLAEAGVGAQVLY